MSAQVNVPVDPPIFHITHVENLPGILREGGLWCDAQRIKRGLSSTNIGHMHIKQRRLTRAVTTRAGGTLGDYVPFNFCPRSVMLYAVRCGHQDYNGGQGNVVHLVSSVSRAVALGRAWAFTDRHAELAHVMPLRDWRTTKEERQAEFLVHEFFSWTAVTEVAAMTSAATAKVQQALGGMVHQPSVTTKPLWYY